MTTFFSIIFAAVIALLFTIFIVGVIAATMANIAISKLDDGIGRQNTGDKQND